MKALRRTGAGLLFLIFALGSARYVSGCAGDGGARGTTFTGNLQQTIAFREPRRFDFALRRLFDVVTTAYAQVSGVEVCIQGTSNCTTTDESGEFTVSGPAEGTVSLRFIGEDFEAELRIDGVRRGGRVRVVNVSCDESEGTCTAEEVRFEGGGVRCESGAITVTPSEQQFTIDGGGEDCIRARGCNVTITGSGGDLVLTNCERCIDAREGAEVTIRVTGGNVSCDATNDGIRTEDDATVSLSADGANDDVTIIGGEEGIEARDASVVELSATGTCVIQGDEDAIRRDSTATVDVSGCANVELRGEERVD